MVSYRNPFKASLPSFPASAFPSIPIWHRDGAAACGESGAVNCKLLAVNFANAEAAGLARLARHSSLATIHFLQALRAVPSDFGARHGDFHVEVAGDLILQLFVKIALEFADLAAAQARDMDVVPRPVRLIIVPVAPQVEQVQLVDQAFFFQQVNRAVNRDEVYASVNLLRAIENLIHVQVLLSVVHDLQDDAPLPRHANPACSRRLLESSRGFRGIQALTGGNAM